MSPRVLFAHERPGVCRAVEHVLRSRGFDTTVVRSSTEAMALLRAQSFAAFVVDVALPGQPGFELIEPAKALHEQGCGAQVVVLVASVFRKTSYKRRPARLYGADDYVELHHLGDMLPDKLGTLLGLRADPDHTAAVAEAEATELMYAEADARLEQHDVGRLAALIVADMVLYNGDRISATRTVDEARVALRDDLDIARDLMRQVRDASGSGPSSSQSSSQSPGGDAAGVDDAFTTLMTSMGRIQESA